MFDPLLHGWRRHLVSVGEMLENREKLREAIYLTIGFADAGITNFLTLFLKMHK